MGKCPGGHGRFHLTLVGYFGWLLGWCQAKALVNFASALMGSLGDYRRDNIYMGLVTALFLLGIATGLFVAVKKGYIKDSLNELANVATIVALLAAIAVFVIPAAIPTSEPNVQLTHIPAITPNRPINDFATLPPYLSDMANRLDYIRLLPDMKAIEYRKAKIGWDSGENASMANATYEYTDFLKRTLESLANYYPPGTFEPGYFDKVITERFEFHRKQLEPEGVGTGGTIVTTIAGGNVVTDLDNMIVGMVSAITQNETDFDFIQWKESWSATSTNP